MRAAATSCRQPCRRSSDCTRCATRPSRHEAPAGDVTCVFRDRAFAYDVAKTNLAEILKRCGIENAHSL